ncbi:MAG TPA: hypothetical protein VIK60_14185 [Vicinamibacterales bacterium]
MRTIHFRSLSVGALTLLVSAGSAAAQTTTSAVLNSLEVQELIKRGEPADHGRLGVHFAVLAEQYAADAKRHNAMARAFVATPTRRTAANSSADHCRRLEQLNLQSADALRALAAHHDALAEGKPSVAPRDAGRFERGEGAPAPTAEQLSALAAKASTPADHRGLAEYFETTARRYTREANDHATMAQAYRGTRISQAAAHCDRLVTLARDSAKEATTAAVMHTELANVAR